MRSVGAIKYAHSGNRGARRIVSQLNTEDSNAGGGLGRALAMYGSIFANRLGMERQS
jgi:hypothetical protein